MSDWQVTTVTALRDETSSVRTIVLSAPNWAGHLAGQHVDVRLTAEDGYAAERSYSIASPAGNTHSLELTVEHLSDGEVSSFLTQELTLGDDIELRGPIGGYFTWTPADLSPLMLIAAGSGIVPLMAMLRTRDRAAARSPVRLLYSSRTVEHIIYRAELDHLQLRNDGFSLVHTLTRGAPVGWRGESRRVDREMLERIAFEAGQRPIAFLCGPTAFVETVADHLLALGYSATTLKTERFGPTGER